MYQAPTAIPVARHRPFWRWIWVLLIASGGAASYLLLNDSMQTRLDPGTAAIGSIAAGIPITLLTWTLVAVYAKRWAARRFGGQRALVILLSPLLVLIGLWLWIQVAPGIVAQRSGTMRLILTLGPPWFGMVVLTYLHVLWPHHGVQPDLHEPPA